MKIDVHNSLDKYEQWLAPARERFAASSGIRAIEASSDEVFLESFLLHFCALGTRMTEPSSVGFAVQLNVVPRWA